MAAEQARSERLEKRTTASRRKKGRAASVRARKSAPAPATATQEAEVTPATRGFLESDFAETEAAGDSDIERC